MPSTIDSVCQALAAIAPTGLAEDWDNVGLLVGDRSRPVRRVMTCLTITPAVAEEALDREVDLIVTHHPLPFRPLNRITCDSTSGAILWQLIGASVSIYSAHTAFDSAQQGINQTWADTLNLSSVRPLIDSDDANVLGSGRYGRLPGEMNAADVVRDCARAVGLEMPPRVVGPVERTVNQVGFACGSGGSFVSAAVRCGCDVLITGEASFHDCLEAESAGMVLGLLGHYHSERFAMEQLAERLAAEFPGVEIWASRNESDPVRALEW